jgi:pyruvate dehydrogenase E2 component (dihydrolipoamide acetyltransferase)
MFHILLQPFFVFFLSKNDFFFRDVELYIIQGGENAREEIPMSDFIDEKAPLLKRVIAKRMLESKTTIPHFYLSIDVDVRNLIELRKELNAEGATKISYNDMMLKAIGLTLVEHPECNVSFVDEMIRQYKNVDVCLAVSVEGGLLTPRVTDCDKKSVFEINAAVQELIAKARNKRLRPKEGMGGSFTLSNLGMFAIEDFIAILNPPQPMILAVGAIRELPVVEDGKITVGQRMKMNLSCDHRVLDGAMCAVFLTDLKKTLENPKPSIA